MKCIIYITDKTKDLVINKSKGHSVFQEIVALNIPYCSEYCIFVDSIIFGEIDNQMRVFQCLKYRLIDFSCSDNKLDILSAFQDSKEKAYVLSSDDFENIISLSKADSETYKKLMIKTKKSPKSVNELSFDNSIICDSKSNVYATSDVEHMIKLSPAFKDYIWGGTKLREIYHKSCDYDIIAESWELSAHEAGQSIVASGKHKGQKFGDYLAFVGKDVLGWKCRLLQSFPLLIKFIDAKGNLSVQVHPDDDYALEHENQYGKNEMWYVIDSEPGAGLYVGFNRDVSREEVEERVKNNTVMEVLNFYPTKPGDVFFIPAGTVYAIGAGNLICEIQQSSNCTYRLYDYDRRDKFGNPRELHLEKALDVLNFNKYEQQSIDKETDGTGSAQVRCKYFESTLYEVTDKISISFDDDKFYSVVCISGQGCINVGESNMNIEAGECIFISAQNITLNIEGKLLFIKCNI